ncbi:MAG: TetR/AcrR family transcriptional regulator [Suipraeoptans sp.]
MYSINRIGQLHLLLGGGIIYSNFLSISEDKQERILKAALRQFGLYGYKKTSTEQLAKSAGISKGMIFHYFGTKKGLYEYLVKYSMDYIRGYFTGLSDRVKDLDFVDRINVSTKTKMKAYLRKPEVFEFGTQLFLNPEELEVSKIAQTTYNEMMEFRNAEVQGVMANDASADDKILRNDMDSTKIHDYITWIVEGYTNKIIGLVKTSSLTEMDLDPFWDEFDEILEDVKKIFYK